MRNRIRIPGLFLGVLVALAGCGGGGRTATPFDGSGAKLDRVPVEALRAAAAEIERQVYEGNREPVLTNREGLVVDTPAVRQAVSTRAARVELVNALLDTGHAWERRNGRIWILVTDEYKKSASSRRRDIDAITVNGENDDRWRIYEGLMDENKIPRSGLSAVQQIFFDERRAFMSSGQIYEGPDGDQMTIP